MAKAALRIYDPFFCEGRVVRLLSGLGFENVYNRNEDFYAAKAAGMKARRWWQHVWFHRHRGDQPSSESDSIQRCTTWIAHHRLPLHPTSHNANAATGKLPEFDVLVTNPPFSGDHIERTLAFALACRKPWFLLLPQVGPCVQVGGKGGVRCTERVTGCRPWFSYARVEKPSITKRSCLTEVAKMYKSHF